MAIEIEFSKPEITKLYGCILMKKTTLVRKQILVLPGRITLNWLYTSWKVQQPICTMLGTPRAWNRLVKLPHYMPLDLDLQAEGYTTCMYLYCSRRWILIRFFQNLTDGHIWCVHSFVLDIRCGRHPKINFKISENTWHVHMDVTKFWDFVVEKNQGAS